MNVEEIISSVARQFDLDQLKPKQTEVISAFVGGRDILFPFQLVMGNELFMPLRFHLFLIVLKVMLLYDI